MVIAVVCVLGARSRLADDGGAIGRRYRRQDEVGTPFGITVDGQSTQDGTVTVRDRDTLQQVRIAADQLRTYLGDRITQAS